MDGNSAKRALIVRHVPREGLAGFREPIEAAGYSLDRLDVADAAFRDADLLSPDLVVLMGGPMGVYEGDAHRWIAGEIERIAERLEQDLPTLGVCFGAQLIAAALGAPVYAGAAMEVGFAPLTLTQAGRNSPVAHLADVPVLHWHGDTFDLPPGTELLASTEEFAHQAFRRGPNLLALQCHAEMGLDPRIDEWIAESIADFEAAEVRPESMRLQHHRHGARAVAAGQRMIGDWIGGLAGSHQAPASGKFASGSAKHPELAAEER